MRCSFSLGLVLSLLITSIGLGQGILISDSTTGVPLPRPILVPQPVVQSSYQIKELAITARIEDQVARIGVTQSFLNTGEHGHGGQFLLSLAI
jgi:Ca-activated chloride channel homolog